MDKILVVDDDPAILKLIKLKLERNDWQVSTTENSENALDKMNGEGFDLALIDLDLNGKSGLDLMEQMHGMDPTVPVIILTGYGTVESAVEAMKKGAKAANQQASAYDNLTKAQNKNKRAADGVSQRSNR